VEEEDADVVCAEVLRREKCHEEASDCVTFQRIKIQIKEQTTVLRSLQLLGSLELED